MSAETPSLGAQAARAAGAATDAAASLRLFQVFVNVDGLRIRGRRFLGVPLPSRKRYGLYSVMLLAAGEESRPPLLLTLARDALTAEFSSISATPPEAWTVQMVDWRMVGAAPPMFRRPGCIDDGWGAAWYECSDPETKRHRYRLVKLRLWKGRRAKSRPPTKPVAGGPPEARGRADSRGATDEGVHQE